MISKKNLDIGFAICRSFGLALGIGLSYGTASAAVITFEGLADATPITSELTPLKMTNSVVLSTGQSLNEFEFPPRSGTNVVADVGGSMSLTFESASNVFLSFAAYFTYASPLTIAGYDNADNLLQSVRSLFSSNLLESGDVGSSSNELMQLAFDSGVHRITITGDALGSSFVMDDLTFTSDGGVIVLPPAVPEPSTTLLLALGLGMLVIFSRRSARRRLARQATTY